ncbi:MAG: rubredoxin [Bacteroidota bacterium]
MAKSKGLETLHFGSRQDIIFPFVEDRDENEGPFPIMNFISNRKYKNIVSSYVSADIFADTPWLNGARYLYILESFNYYPQLEINITDPRQQLVPLFTGRLNFIASEEEDYWYLYVRFNDWDGIQCYPVLIYSWDIPTIALAIENVYKEVSDVKELFEEVSNEVDTNNRTISKPLNVAFNAFPYYEGMNKVSSDKYWLGLYWRNNCYDVPFLKAMADLCLECKIGKICLTPWKSLIVKGIPEASKLKWEKLLGKFGINVRHSSLELNWHLPLADLEALELKKYIVRNFDQNDISTYGLTFSIKSNYGVNFTSVVIEKNPIPSIVQKFDIRPSYNVLYCEQFNPNRLKYITYAQDVDKIELPGLLMELSRLYFEQLGEYETPIAELNISSEESVPKLTVYKCQECLTVYDPRY